MGQIADIPRDAPTPSPDPIKTTPATVTPAPKQEPAPAPVQVQVVEDRQNLAGMILAQTSVTITATVNLANFESLKIGVTGPAVAASFLKTYLNDLLGTYGRDKGVTAEAIDHYRRRVLAGVQE